MQPSRLWPAAAAAMAGCLLSVGVACSRRDETPPQRTPETPTSGGRTGAAPLQGDIRISGAWALHPMVLKWAEEFQKIHPGVKIDVSTGGAGKGVTDALSGLVDLGMVSRELRPEEVAQGAAFVAVTKDAVFPTMNAANPVAGELARRGLRKQDLQALWLSGASKTWGELAATGSSDPVAVYTRSDACGAAETWAKYLGAAAQGDLLGTAVYGDPGLAEAVRKDANGVGYNNLGYAYDIRSGQPVEGLRIIPIDVNENGAVDPEEDISTKRQALAAIAAGVYPSPPARDLYLVTKSEFKGLAKEFVRWILTDGQKHVDEAGYIRLSEPALRAALGKL